MGTVHQTNLFTSISSDGAVGLLGVHTVQPESALQRNLVRGHNLYGHRFTTLDTLIFAREGTTANKLPEPIDTDETTREATMSSSENMLATSDGAPGTEACEVVLNSSPPSTLMEAMFAVCEAQQADLTAQDRQIAVPLNSSTDSSRASGSKITKTPTQSIGADGVEDVAQHHALLHPYTSLRSTSTIPANFSNKEQSLTRTGDFSLKTSETVNRQGLQSICLCQSTPKIPRPRNAFILFRQHHHQAMVDQNPGRANPEISKLIGIMWKEGSQATRDEWLKHAEMEKKQHFLRYPEYRYQPRRHGKKSPGSTTGILSTAGNVFCNACGGKLGTNSVPNTPLTPSYPPATPQTPRVPVYQAAPFSVSVWDVAKKKRLDSRAGLEASLQLEVQRGDTENPDNLPQAKRRKANASAASSPIPGKVSRSKSSLLKRPLDNAAFYDTNVTFHQHGPQHTTTIPTSISVIQKFQAIKKIVQPLPTSLSTSRGVIIAIDGENVVQVNQFITILKKYMPESISRNILEKSPEGIQNENNDINVAIASYLGSVANWRLKAIKTLQASVSLANIEDSSRLNTISKYPLILLNRYILSRSNDAVETLVFDDGLTAAEHWQWCANIWRGNVGADMTIWVNENGPNGCVEILSGDLVIVSAGENGEWERTTIRRVVFEIGECMKDLGALE